VLANILAPVLRELAPQLIEAASVGGRIVLSGMRTEQVDGVIAEYTECALVARVENEGWAAVVLERVSV
jgi:ribosomal protein L11 methylase PrmA